MATNISPISPNIFICVVCTITCNRKSEWVRHLQTKKHLGNKTGENGNILATTISPFICECGKNYINRTSLWRHKKKCCLQKTHDNIGQTDSNLIIQLIQQNQDFKEMLMEQNTKMIETFNEALKNNNNSITTNNHVNSHNKTFNMNVFLNEHCKDAMNISEFVDSIQLGFNDLVNVGKVGYVEGISSIIINKLRSLDIHKRPMHCGDEKRHSMYIKEDGKWEKQPEDNNRVRRLIKQVAFKNTKNTVLFKEKYPDCGTSASKYSDQYNKIVMESFGGRGASDEEKENKIVRMIAKEVYIDKSL
jgi:hypothetical protein